MTSLLLHLWPWLLVAAALLLTLGLGRLLLPDEPLPYEKQPSIVEPHAQPLYRALLDAGQQRWTICPMVRLADVIRVRTAALKRSNWLGPLQSRRLDFVLCDPANLEAKLAVTLLEPPATGTDEPEGDRFLASALAAARLPLLQVEPAGEYKAEELRTAIHQLLGITDGAKR